MSFAGREAALLANRAAGLATRGPAPVRARRTRRRDLRPGASTALRRTRSATAKRRSLRPPRRRGQSPGRTGGGAPAPGPAPIHPTRLRPPQGMAFVYRRLGLSAQILKTPFRRVRQHRLVHRFATLGWGRAGQTSNTTAPHRALLSPRPSETARSPPAPSSHPVPWAC